MKDLLKFLAGVVFGVSIIFAYKILRERFDGYLLEQINAEIDKRMKGLKNELYQDLVKIV